MTPPRLTALPIASFLLLLVSPVGALAAQQADSGIVAVTVEESMGMLAGFRVQSAGKNAITDANGRARLTLPAGRQTIRITRLGFLPSQVNVVVVRDSVVSVTVKATMGEMAMELEDVRISSARIERLAGDTPLRVEVVDEMEVEEKTVMAPSGITMLLNETPGVRVQAASPSLGTGSVRILGLPGQYTSMLADGLPLYGSASALGPLDISPVDLQRVELIKGAASALYGAQALGGVINLVAKPPTGKKELLLNRRTMGVTDAASWLSHRFSESVGVSLLAAGTTQRAQDIDDDGWADQAEATRWNLRPRLNAVDARGRSLFVTAGYGFDDREGGTLGSALAPDGQPFREALRSRRADVGAMVRIPLRAGGSDPATDAGSVAVRFALASTSRERAFGAGPLEKDRLSTGFAEVTRSFVSERGAAVIGTAVQLDAYANRLNDAYDRDWVTPGLFVTADREIGAATLSASVRADAHPDAGLRFTERLAILVKPSEEWSLRGSIGTGFSPSSVNTEETEAVGLRALIPGPALDPERSLGAMIDINGRLVGAEVLVTVYSSSITDGVQLVELVGQPAQASLQNAAGQARMGGVEVLGVWRFEGGKFIASYGHSRGTRSDATTGDREPIPLLPRHRLGGDLMLERPGVYRMGIEGIYYGAQPLDDDPYRTTSKPYFYTMALIAWQFGPVEVVANFENLLNVRQTDTDPLVRPARGMAGRWTNDVWAPLEGFMANVALRYRWE